MAFAEGWTMAFTVVPSIAVLAAQLSPSLAHLRVWRVGWIYYRRWRAAAATGLQFIVGRGVEPCLLRAARGV